MKIVKWFSFVLVLIAFNSCQSTSSEADKKVSPMERLPNNEVGELVRKAIDAAGGWEKWSEKKTFSFNKKITSLDSLGQVKKSFVQLHQYILDPSLKIRMSWEDDGKEYVIINNGKEAKKFENGKEMMDESSKNSAWNSSFGSHYMIAMPFKLTDPGSILTYEGIDTTILDRKVHVINVQYEKGAGSAGGMHTWRYYFDENNYELLANYLDSGNGYSLTIYDTSQVIDGIRIHNRRQSYRSDEDKNMVLKGTLYENGSMKFDKNFDESLFEFN